MRRFALCFLAALGLAPTAGAGAPSPANSVVPCVRASLGNGLRTRVTVRDLSNNPIVGSTVVIEFSDCPGFVHCPERVPPGTRLDYTWDPVSRTARMNTWLDGRADFFLKGGGIGLSGSVRVYADGVLLATSALFSPDQNGDLVVDGTDLAIENTKVGTADPTGDLDCNGIVDSEDLRQIEWWGYQCVIPTANERPTWGQVKIRYR